MVPLPLRRRRVDRTVPPPRLSQPSISWRPMLMIDRLRALGEEGLADLLRERPVLLDHCSSLLRLAGIVESPYGVSEALCHLNAFEHGAAEVLAALGPVDLTEVATALGAPPGSAAAAAAVAHLDRLFLVDHLPDGRVAGSTALVDHLVSPLDLGRPLWLMQGQLDVAKLRTAAGLLGLPTNGTKRVVVDAISHALRDQATVRNALAKAPPGTLELVERCLDDVLVDVGYGLPSPPVAWLLDRMMLVRATPYSGPAELPQEVGLALRGPAIRPVSPTAPRLISQDVPDVDGAAAHHSAAVLALLTSLLDVLDAEPAKAIQSGELGVRDLRRLAKAADIDEVTVGRLLEMARAAGLVGTISTPGTPTARRASRWQPEPPLVEWLPTSAYDDWLSLPPGRRWTALAGAWVDSTAWPSRAGARADGKTTAAFSSHDDAAAAPALRRLVLGLLDDLGTGRAAPVVELGEAVAWHRPWSAAWRSTSSTGLVKDVLAEAELLGVAAGGALSSLGRALLTDAEAAATLAQSVLPAPGRDIMLQADLTAIAAGPLERDVAAELSTMADLESRGAASVWRISDASVRRCLDQGGSAERMLAFLEQHAAKGVPQPLRYLVGDTARRHGSLRVAAAASVVTSDDPALLAEVRATRKAAKLQLRQVAPTVLVSPRPAAAVLETLRAAGFLPAAESDDGTIALARKERRRAPAVPARVAAPAPTGDPVAAARRLLDDRPAPARGSTRSLDDFERILADNPFAADPMGGAADEDDLLLSTDLSAHDLLAKAAENGSEVIVFAMGGRRGKDVLGTVALLTEATVLLRDPDGRTHALALDSILSILECP